MTLLWKHHGWLSRSFSCCGVAYLPTGATTTGGCAQEQENRHCLATSLAFLPRRGTRSSCPRDTWRPRRNSGTRFSPALARARYSSRRLRDTLLFSSRKRKIRVDGKGGGGSVLIDPRRPYRCSRVSVKSLQETRWNLFRGFYELLARCGQTPVLSMEWECPECQCIRSLFALHELRT